MTAPIEQGNDADATALQRAASITEFLAIWLEADLLPPEHQRAFDKYYGSYKRHFPARLQHYYGRQIREVLGLIRETPRCRVLEIGSGMGTESLWMAMQGASVHAVELTPERFQVALARKELLERSLGRSLECEFVNMSLLDLADEELFDIIWMEQAFHHLEPRNQVIEKLASLLKPGGHMVISEANALNPLLQLQLFRRRGFKTLKEFQGPDGRIHAYGDERILGARRLTNLLERVGIAMSSVSHYRLFPNHRWFDGLLAVEEAAPKWMFPLFTHYNYVGRKASAGQR